MKYPLIIALVGSLIFIILPTLAHGSASRVLVTPQEKVFGNRLFMAIIEKAPDEKPYIGLEYSFPRAHCLFIVFIW
jgi:hypothetical protein